MTTACIVQARVGSSRLPGKILLDLAGEPVLAHVLRRCLAIANVDRVVCAVPDEPASASIAAIAIALGVAIVRGPETDLVERYRLAAEAVDADIILRVTSDCPLIDPALCSQVVRPVLASEADYAANNFVHGFPHGLDCEAFSRKLLERCASEAVSAYDREHVGPWMRRHTEVRRASIVGPGGHMVGWRWTLDHPEDYEFLAALVKHLPAPIASLSWETIAEIVRRNPDLLALNAARSTRTTSLPDRPQSSEHQ
jgi:spore coat polysaccharide biosynthesis protein SpsF